MPSCRLAAALAPLAALALLSAPAHAEAVKAGKWTPIFDGRSLDGWTPKIAGYPAGENYAQTFVVQDGAITVSYAGYDGKFGGKVSIGSNNMNVTGNVGSSPEIKLTGYCNFGGPLKKL